MDSKISEGWSYSLRMLVDCELVYVAEGRYFIKGEACALSALFGGSHVIGQSCEENGEK